MAKASTTKSRRAGESYDGDLRRALLDATIACHAQTGYDALSLRAVARAVGVSHAAPAHHFGSKAGLITTIAIEGFELLLGRLHDVGAKSEKGATLRELGVAYVGFAASSPAHYEAMFRPEIINHDDERFVAASNAAYAEFAKVVYSFQAAGWKPDADTITVSTALWALIHGLCLLRKERSLKRRHPEASETDLVEIAMSLVLP
ncbi:MAG: TetR/AcrR family transcriptional regulator [Polyangiales bacterium]